MLRKSVLIIGISAVLLLLSLISTMGDYMQVYNSFAQDISTQSTNAILAGYYTGTVAINEPLALGILDLSIALADNNGSLSGILSNNGTLAFPSSSALQGSITAPTQGITPTFSLRSEPINSVVSGRPVARTLALIGEILGDGDVLRGTYQEEITGFTPDALKVKGTFLLSRGSDTPPMLATPVTPAPGGTPTATSLPTATASATPTLRPGETRVAEDDTLYLPIIEHGQNRTQFSEQERQLLETPVPTSESNDVVPMSTPTPTSTIDLAQDLPNTIYLPDIKR